MKWHPMIVLIVLTTSVYVVGDTGTGGFTGDIDNDPAIVIEYWDPSSILDPDIVVTTFIEFVDIDNTTEEMTVTLHYTLDSGLTNSSFNMNYQTTKYNTLQNYPSYTFVYQLPSQPRGTYLEYYYTIFDGNTTIRAPINTGLWLDAQWGEPYPIATLPPAQNVVIIGGDKGDNVENIYVDNTVDDITVMLLSASFIFLIWGGWKRQSESKVTGDRQNDKMTKVSMRKRNWRGSATGRLLENLEEDKNYSDDE